MRVIALTLTVTPRGRQAPISRGDPSSQKGKLGLPDGVNSSSQAAAKWGVSTDSCPAVSAVCWDPSSLSGDNWSHSPPHVHPYRETEHPWARGTETQGKSKGVCVCVSVCVCVCESLSPVRLFATPGSVTRQASPVHGILQARILEWVGHFLLQEEKGQREVKATHLRRRQQKHQEEPEFILQEDALNISF